MKTHSNVINAKIQAALIKNLYKEAIDGLIASFLASILLFMGLYPVTNHTLLISWFCFFALVTFIRFLTIMFYSKDKAAELNYIKWRRIFIVGVAISGACWGFAGSILFPYPHLIQMVLAVIIMTGVAAVSVISLCSQLTAMLVFLILVLLPVCIRLTFVEDHTLFLSGIGSYIYLIFLIAMAFKSYRVIKHSISLQFENQELLQSLSKAKLELEKTNQKIIKSLTHDSLTNLLNRNSFDNRFGEIVERASIKRQSLALFHLNLDGFKEVNEIYSHRIGNLLLRRIVDRIKPILGDQILFARLGGDEFVIVLEAIKNIDFVTDIAKKICAEASIPLEIENYNLLMTLSVGISIFPVDGQDVETLLRSADQALHKIKALGGNNFKFCSDPNTLKNILAT